MKKAKKREEATRKDCPYLDTVNRQLLDFDFEKICSASFTNLNVYACLVCGKNFQGRAEGSHAHYHCLQANHHVFINLHTQRIYCLPDDYEVIDPSLDDIKFLLNPTFTRSQIDSLDSNARPVRALDGTLFVPGIVGLNNTKSQSYINVVVQALARVPPVRNFLMSSDLPSRTSRLVANFGELMRKIWNPRNFKGQVSPHELIQAIQNASNRRYTLAVESDPLEFLQWLLNTMHADLGGGKGANSPATVISQAFSGAIEVTTSVPARPAGEDGSKARDASTVRAQTTFMNLALDLPPRPVFKDEHDKSIIPQVPLFTLLAKYDGVTPRLQATGESKIYRLLRLPRYLIFCVKRFSHNNFFKEKETTIVNFPLKNLDLTDYLSEPLRPKDNNGVVIPSKYHLLANIKHEGDPNSGSYTVYLFHKGSDKWFEIQDLTIKDTLPQLVAVSEAYILIYEKSN
eukprot:gene14926-17650_t